MAHRAFTDCFALLRALCAEPPASSGKANALKQLFESARIATYRIWAQGAHFDKSPLMKARDYKWSPGTVPGSLKAWNFIAKGETLKAELEWLGEEVFSGRRVIIPIERVTARNRYSNRFAAPRHQELPLDNAEQLVA